MQKINDPTVTAITGRVIDNDDYSGGFTTTSFDVQARRIALRYGVAPSAANALAERLHPGLVEMLHGAGGAA